MTVHTDLAVATCATIDGTPVQVKLLKAARRVQIIVGIPGGSHMILELSDPAYITRFAREITEAGIDLAFLRAATDLHEDRPGALGTLRVADGPRIWQ